MNILHTNKEQHLLGLFSRGDASAMDKLYAEYSGYLAGVAYRYLGNDDDVKDVLQEAFIKIFTQIDSFEYKGKGALKAWLTRIVINEALMFLRKSDKERNLFVDSDDSSAGKQASDDAEPDSSDIDISVIMEMVARLPVGYRTVFNLFAIEGLDHKTIAQQLGITASTSASQYHKARAMLARMIKDYRKGRTDG